MKLTNLNDEIEYTTDADEKRQTALQVALDVVYILFGIVLGMTLMNWWIK